MNLLIPSANNTIEVINKKKAQELKATQDAFKKAVQQAIRDIQMITKSWAYVNCAEVYSKTGYDHGYYRLSNNRVYPYTTKVIKWSWIPWKIEAAIYFESEWINDILHEVKNQGYDIILDRYGYYASIKISIPTNKEMDY